MEEIRQIIQSYYVEIIFGLALAFLLLLVLYLIDQIRISKLKSRYDQWTKGMDGINIEKILLRNGEEINRLWAEINSTKRGLDKLDIKLGFAIQKIGFIRYNAFGDMGSELSFSIVFLDDFRNGFVLTSIYGREQSVIYAKPIKDGKSLYPLSVEEIQAVDRAIKGENTNL